MPSPLALRTAAWWAFSDYCKLHQEICANTKLKKPPKGVRVWKTMAERMASEQKQAELYREYHRWLTICHEAGFPAQTVGELTVKDAPQSSGERSGDPEFPW